MQAITMYPTKSMLDYLSEINRLFPRYNENDIFATPNTNSQVFNQSFGQSSSSTDTSPDSLSDMMGFQCSPEQNLHSPSSQYQKSPARPNYSGQSYQNHDYSNSYNPLFHLHETPLTTRRDRPMVRKIITESVYLDEIPNIWGEGQTPSKTCFNQKIEYYELFPSNSGQNDFGMSNSASGPSQPNKSANMSPFKSVSPQASSMSLNGSDMSPWVDSMSEFDPYTPSSLYHSSPESSALTPVRVSFREPIVAPSSTALQNFGSKMCTFCRKNGETPLVYTTHNVRETFGKRSVVTCPILRSLVCSMCGASGDNAHTISYCPVLLDNNHGRPLPSTTITLKNTRVKSNGRRRF